MSTNPPTLLEDLETLAVHHQERATATDEPGFSKWIHGDLAQRCRDHARRLARKVAMAEAIGKALDHREYVSPNDVARRELTLEIINAGPLVTP